MAAASARSATKGWTLNERTTRRIIGSTTVALWVTIALTAHVKISLHWYAAILLAAALAGCAVLICIHRAQHAAGTAEGDVKRICEAIEAQTAHFAWLTDQHAKRVESATVAHGDRMEADVFDLRHWVANKYRGQALAQLDAAMEADRRSGSDTGPLPIISTGPR